MAKAPDKGTKLDEGKSVGAGNQKQVDRLLKKAADQAAKAAKRKWKRAGRNPFAKHAKGSAGAFERAFRSALEGALNYRSNHGGERPSIKMRALDTGGRPFHFDHTAVSSQTINLKPGETAKAGSTYGKRKHAREKRHTSRSAAHMQYLEREGAAETIEADMAAAAEVRAETEELGREITPGGMQAYLEDPSKDESLKAGREAPKELVFSYGTISDTLEERVAFWDLAEEHARGERGTIQHRLIMELPHEAAPEDRLAIMKAFTAKFDEDKVPYHVVLHAPTSKNDSRNYHAHVVLLARPAEMIDWPLGGDVKVGPLGPLTKTWDFAAKSFQPDAFRVTKWRFPKRQNILKDYRETFVKDQRKRFSDIVNERMAAVGNPVRYDHRSYRAMGLETQAMKSITRIIKDKAKKGSRVVLQYAQTKREVEAEIDRLARERAPEFAEISRVRAAVRSGERALRALEKEAGFLRRKPILKRGAYAVNAFVRKRALDYARTRALHLERTIEAAQQLRSVERVIEATDPKTVAKLRHQLADSIVKARASGNKRETERLKLELQTIPKTAYAAILHKVATEEAAALRAWNESQARIRLGKVREALARWTSAAAGERPEILPARTTHEPSVAGVAPAQQPQAVPIRQQRPGEHPMWGPLDEVADKVFTTPVAKFAWEMHKRFGQFIIDNADPDVPGRTPMDLAKKLIDAVKEHPAKAEELMMSYERGHEIGVPPRQAAQAVPSPPAETDQPVFRGRASMPRPRPAPPVVMEEASAFGVTSDPSGGGHFEREVSRLPPAPAPPRAPEPGSDAQTVLKGETIEEKKRKRLRRRERQRAILAQRGGWER